MKIKKLILRFIILVILAFFIVVLGMRALYPIKYLDIIGVECEKYSVQPSLILAIIRAESNFKEDAASSKGAIGLMQLMPETAEWAKGKSGIYGDTTDPEVNIKLGIWYFAGYLMPKYDNNIELAIMAYNAGEGKVEKYEGNVPYAETQNYVEKTMKNYDIYNKLLKIYY